MPRTTIAVDLAKNVFEVAVSNRGGTVHERRRMSRPQFERFWAQREPCRVVMEACATAHFWARELTRRGFEVALLPPHYVRPYRRRSKTDRTDCEALLEADRCAGIHPVSIKSADQQAIAALHRIRSQWNDTRTARINTMRALLREFGVSHPRGAARFLNALHELLETHRERLPERLRRRLLDLHEEVRGTQERIDSIEAELKHFAAEEPAVQRLMSVPGIGVLTATALYASVGDIHAFKHGRALACWLGLTPREHSTGGRRRLGRISKKGDPYVRMLLIHGARSALLGALRRERAGRLLTHLQRWAVGRAQEMHHNKAVVALANKMARIAWAVWYHERDFDGNYARRFAA